MASIRACGAATLSVVLALPGCAQIITRSTVEINPRADATPLVLGPPGGEVTARGMEAEWTQDGDRLVLQLKESRTCASVRHVPVVRVERVDRRTAGGAMWFEYGLGAAALATGLAGLIRPEAFSQGSATVDGQLVEDTSAGLRIGGIFTGLGAILLTAAVVDTVRTRNEVIYTDAYRREQGGSIECRDPLVPLQAQTVELLVDEWSTVEPTGDDGTVRFLLPAVEDLPEHAREVIEATAKWDAAEAEAEAAAKAAEEARAAAEAEAARGKRGKGKGKSKGKSKGKGAEPEAASSADGSASTEAKLALGPRPEPMMIKGVLRVDSSRALAVDFLVPYEAERARQHHGQGAVEPIPPVDPPPQPRVGERERDAEDGASSGAASEESQANGEAEEPGSTREESGASTESGGPGSTREESETSAEAKEPGSTREGDPPGASSRP
ncbi:MAG: hypothetical protein AAGF11_12560 [Myxococcota bacterium]